MTKIERERINQFRHIGCCVTGSTQYEVHHLTDGGRRLGHLFTIPLSAWHHRGVPSNGHSQNEMLALYGPSLAKSRILFEKKYGTQYELLEAVNKLIGFKK